MDENRLGEGKRMISKKNGAYIIFLFVLIIQLITMTYFASEKEGYHVDELWSYGLANSYYFPHIFMDDNLDINWVDGEFFRSYITANEGEKFAYGSVKYNMEHDSHPPMYFAVLHTISSFFPDTFSKWFGLIPNIIFYGVSVVILYHLSVKALNNSYLAILPCIYWGFSKGAVSVVVYIRMYCMVTMWALCFANLHYKMIVAKKQTVKEMVLTTIFTFCGFMTHYFFIIFAFFGAAYYSLFLMFQKRWKDFVKYCIAMAVNFIFVLILYPMAYRYLFVDGYGSSMVQQISYFENWISNIKVFCDIINQQLFGYWGWGFIFLIFLVAVVYYIFQNTSRIQNEGENKYVFSISSINIEVNITEHMLANGFLMVASIGYFAVVSKISPYLVDRYIFLIYPFVVLLIILLVVHVIRRCHIPKYGFACAFLLMAFMTARTYALGIEYLYRGQGDYPQIMREYSGLDCLFITFDYYELVRDSLELENLNMIHAIAPSNMHLVKQFVEELGHPDRMIIYLAPAYNNEEMLNQILELSGYTNYTWLFTNGCTAYLFG